MVKTKRSTRRDWFDARDHHKGRPCRVCFSAENVQLHHTAGRVFDFEQTNPHRADAPVRILWVDPVSVVPLCSDCHQAAHSHTLDLLPHLTYPEQAFVAKCLGIVRAYKRLTPEKEIA